MEENREKKRHPAGFYVCSLTFTLERLAYCGAKPLFLLFLITAAMEGGLGINEEQATILTANLAAYTYLAPIFGGYICDRWLGARYAIPLGLVLMSAGYLIGWKAQSAAAINLMVLVISIGTGFFKGNVPALVGRMYDDSTMLDSAFSIQYSFVGIGTFAGSLITGYLYLNTFRHGDILGFRQCFLISAVFCLTATVWFVANWRLLRGQGIRPFKYRTDWNGNVIGEAEKKEKKGTKSTAPLTPVEKRRVLAIVLVSVFSIVFWLFYYQNDLALTIYMTKYIKMSIGSFDIAPGWINTTLNGLLCVALGGVMAAVWRKLSERPQGDLNMFQKVGLGFLFLGLAFGIIVAAEFVRGIGAAESHKVSVLWMVGFVLLLTIGEMCFSPLLSAFVSKYAPEKYLSLLMGAIAVSIFFSSKLSPFVQMGIERLDTFPVIAGIFVLLLLCALFMFAASGKLNRLVEDEK